MKKLATRCDDINIPRAQRRPSAPSIGAIAKQQPDRNEAMRTAWLAGEYSYALIAKYFGVHFSTVGRAVRRSE